MIGGVFAYVVEEKKRKKRKWAWRRGVPSTASFFAKFVPQAGV
jgi:hypothetical protein